MDMQVGGQGWVGWYKCTSRWENRFIGGGVENEIVTAIITCWFSSESYCGLSFLSQTTKKTKKSLIFYGGTFVVA